MAPVAVEEAAAEGQGRATGTVNVNAVRSAPGVTALAVVNESTGSAVVNETVTMMTVIAAREKGVKEKGASGNAVTEIVNASMRQVAPDVVVTERQESRCFVILL